jgi:imidazolonepropionase-like amidohydrolase
VVTATAVVGATLIDGHGGEPVIDATVLIRGSKIAECGPRAAVSLPEHCKIIDAAGKYAVPGFIDTNVHLTPFYYYEELIRYRDQYEAIALETAQLLLRSGVTTVRDSYGHLPTLLGVRESIGRGDVIGPRLYIAGNIIGWGALGSTTFDVRGPHISSPDAPGLIDARSSYLLETIQDEFTQGVGEELIAMEPAEVGAAISAYLDKGVDFVKYGGTTHGVTPSLILFSPRVQEVIVRTAHRRGRRVETHATSPEALRMALSAGVDLVQHPETLDAPMSEDLARLHASRGVVCSMNVNRWTGRLWAEHTEPKASTTAARPPTTRPLTGMERRLASHRRAREWWRGNAQKLIAAGCVVSTASDTLTPPPRGIMRGDEPYAKTFYHAPGTATLDAIEGLVEVGMSPMAALQAATRNGAIASGALDEYGTIEAGKSADLLLLDDDPLADIRNIRGLSLVMINGRTVDLAALPERPVHSG